MRGEARLGIRRGAVRPHGHCMRPRAPATTHQHPAPLPTRTSHQPAPASATRTHHLPPQPTNTHHHHSPPTHHSHPPLSPTSTRQHPPTPPTAHQMKGLATGCVGDGFRLLDHDVHTYTHAHMHINMDYTCEQSCGHTESPQPYSRGPVRETQPGRRPHLWGTRLSPPGRKVLQLACAHGWRSGQVASKKHMCASGCGGYGSVVRQ
jgi:hypothetical protein